MLVNGFDKIDFLGLRTLTVLDKTIKNINEKIKPAILTLTRYR